MSVSPARALDQTLPRNIPESIRNASVPRPFSAGALQPRETRAQRRGPLTQTGIRRSVPKTAWASPILSTSAEGRAILTASLQSPGARSVRLRFRDFNAGAGEVWVFSPGSQTAHGPYSGAGIFGTGEFWSAGVDADTVVVAYLAPPGSTPGAFPFTIDAISHEWPAANSAPDSAAVCNFDVTCYPGYGTFAAGVIEYEFISAEDGNSYSCSGALINTRNNSKKPYMLTAHHCIGSDAEAKTIQAHFFYQTAVCNGTAPNRSSVPTVLGGTFLAGAPIVDGDYSLVALTAVPGGATFLGWNASLDRSAAVTGLHHPRGSYTRISFGKRGQDVDGTVGSESAPASSYYYVTWSGGVTEAGSSGSPLLDSHGQIVGTLTGAPTLPAGKTICDVLPFSLYGRFEKAYVGLRSYLEDSTSTPSTPVLSGASTKPDQAAQPGPVIAPGGFGNAASYGPGIAPGSLLAIFGTNLAPVKSQASAIPLPKQLDGVAVTINGIEAPLYYVSPNQLNVQVPIEVPPGLAQVSVSVNGKSDKQSLQIAAVAPGIFNDGLRPVPFGSGRRGEYRMVFITGQGPVSPSPATGATPAAGTPVGELPQFLDAVKIAIGGVPVPILFSGIPSGLVGVSQINFQVPPDTPLGDQPMIVTVGGQPSQVVTFTVEP